jgi:hypothetical protein
MTHCNPALQVLYWGQNEGIRLALQTFMKIILKEITKQNITEYLNNIQKSNAKSLAWIQKINKFFRPQTKRCHQPVLFVPPVSSA